MCIFGKPNVQAPPPSKVADPTPVAQNDVVSGESGVEQQKKKRGFGSTRATNINTILGGSDEKRNTLG